MVKITPDQKAAVHRTAAHVAGNDRTTAEMRSSMMNETPPLDIVDSWAIRPCFMGLAAHRDLMVEDDYVYLTAVVALDQEARYEMSIEAVTSVGRISLTSMSVGTDGYYDYSVKISPEDLENHELYHMLLYWRVPLLRYSDEIFPELLRRFCEAYPVFKGCHGVQGYLRAHGVVAGNDRPTTEARSGTNESDKQSTEECDEVRGNTESA